MYYFLKSKNHYENFIIHFHNNHNWDNGKIPDQNRIIVNINDVLKLYPTNISEQVAMIILNISTILEYIGDTFVVEDDYSENSLLLHLFFLNPNFDLENQMDEILSILIEKGIIKQSETLGDNKVSYTFSALGWSKAQELLKQNEVISQAFIAMWFDESMFDARTSILKAISECGYTPIIIDMKEHNNQIVPEIFYEIKQSSFVVADLSGHRNGVYYEAGYAEALNKQVILTCNEDYFVDMHFDVAQKSTIIWKNKEDLYTRLVKRIEATIGKRK